MDSATSGQGPLHNAHTVAIAGSGQTQSSSFGRVLDPCLYQYVPTSTSTVVDPGVSGAGRYLFQAPVQTVDTGPMRLEAGTRSREQWVHHWTRFSLAQTRPQRPRVWPEIEPMDLQVAVDI